MLALYNQNFTPASVTFMLEGLRTAVMIAVLAAVISMATGTVLALVRTYASGPWKWLGRLVAAYMKFFRCTPNLFWILWIYFTVKENETVVSIFATNLFTSAVMAEIFRGGSSAAPKGQFRAAKSQGFGFGKALWYIVFPQMYKKIIPALLSQVVTAIEDTSFLKMTDVAEFTRNCGVAMGSVYDIRGILILFAFEALCYFIICFMLSCMVWTY